jgi:hypothetical protein
MLLKSIATSKFVRFFGPLMIAVGLFWGVTGLVGATSTARGYRTQDDTLVAGVAVSLSQSATTDNQTVEQATTSNKIRFVGIVTTKNSSVINTVDTKDNVFVTTAGEAIAIASDVNGAIKKGDFLSISPLKGTLMHADSSETNTVGIALEDFSTEGVKTQNILDEKQKQQTVHVGPLNIEVAPQNGSATATDQKAFLTLVGQSITGKPVSTWQVLTALVIFVLLVVIEGAVIYGAVHSTIEALGRNPLAHTVVYKQLLQIMVVMMAILAFGAGTIYAVLWA